MNNFNKIIRLIFFLPLAFLIPGTADADPNATSSLGCTQVWQGSDIIMIIWYIVGFAFLMTGLIRLIMDAIKRLPSDKRQLMRRGKSIAVGLMWIALPWLINTLVNTLDPKFSNRDDAVVAVDPILCIFGAAFVIAGIVKLKMHAGSYRIVSGVALVFWGFLLPIFPWMWHVAGLDSCW